MMIFIFSALDLFNPSLSLSFSYLSLTLENRNLNYRFYNREETVSIHIWAFFDPFQLIARLSTINFFFLPISALILKIFPFWRFLKR